METTLLNPYSVKLAKDPFMTVRSKPIYTHGDYRIYSYYPKHFVHTFKNIVIAERCGQNKEIFTNMTGETTPTGEASIYHDLQRPQEALRIGIEAAKKLNFKIA